MGLARKRYERKENAKLGLDSLLRIAYDRTGR